MQPSLQSILFYFIYLIFSDFVDEIYLFIYLFIYFYRRDYLGEQVTTNYKF